MKKLLIIAPFGNKSAPRQEIIIKNKFIADGYEVQSLTGKDSGFKRLFDIIINGVRLIKENDVIKHFPLQYDDKLTNYETK